MTGSDASRHPEAVSTGRAFRIGRAGLCRPGSICDCAYSGLAAYKMPITPGPGVLRNASLSGPFSRSSLSTRLLPHARSGLVGRGDSSGCKEITRLRPIQWRWHSATRRTGRGPVSAAGVEDDLALAQQLRHAAESRAHRRRPG